MKKARFLSIQVKVVIKVLFLTLFLVTAGVFSGADALSQVINVPAGDTPALIQAIEDANAALDPATINLGGGTYTLTQINNAVSGNNGLPNIVTDMTFNGNGSIVERSTNPATPEFRIFQIREGAGADPNVTFNNLTIRNGVSTSTGGGGLLHASDGIVNINDCIVSDNTRTSGQSAGINNDDFGTMNINRSTITRNIHNGGGAGVGGVINDFGGVLNITESTISHNVGPRGGGVGNNSSGTINMINTTVSDNMNTSDTLASGGGVYNNSGGDIFINFSTISNNEGPAGGNIGNNSSGSIFITNTIVGISIDGPSCLDDGSGDIVSQGYNIDLGSSCVFNSIGDKSNTNPLLDPKGLQDNGGPTLTIALIENSPAIDMADPACPPPGTDQRGFPRPAIGGTSCDIGAFEGILQIAIPTLSEWGLLAMVGIFGITGILVMRRKKVTA